jgi:hypothetical protein
MDRSDAPGDGRRVIEDVSDVTFVYAEKLGFGPEERDRAVASARDARRPGRRALPASGLSR